MNSRVLIILSLLVAQSPLFSAGPSHDVSQLTRPLISEQTEGSDLKTKWKKAADFFSTGERGFFQSGTVGVVYRTFFNPKNSKNIVILTGYAEDPFKYTEMIYDFSRKGYNVFIMSHRGMGESGRFLPNRQIIHIDDPKKYYEDANFFLKNIVQPKIKGNDLFLFTHSTGGLIGAHLLAEHPSAFKSAVLSSPLFGFNTQGYSEAVIKARGFFAAKNEYAPGYRDWNPHQAKFSGQTAIGSLARWESVIDIYRKHPDLVSGGPSTKWLETMINESAPEKTKPLAAKIQTPILILQAGDDNYVSTQRQDEFVKLCSSCQKQTFPTSRHEIYLERDFIRDEALENIFSFLK
jgi:lysophospholipase